MTTPAMNRSIPCLREQRRLPGSGRAPVLVSAAVLACWADVARGQDSLRLSLSNDSAASQRRVGIENLPYTLRLDDFKLLLSGSMEAEYNNNVNLATPSKAQFDEIFRPKIKEDIYWPVSAVNMLTFSASEGYQAFVVHPRYDKWLVSPDSALEWDVFLEHWLINFHDQFSYQQDPTAYGAISGTAIYGGFDNTIGTLATWDLNALVLAFGYDHYNFISSSSRYSYLSRASDFFVARPSLKVHPTATVGLELSAGPTTYEQRVLSDSMSYSAGLHATWELAEHIKVEPRGGYYIYDFTGSPPEVGGGTTQTGYYFSVNVTHQIRPGVNYTAEAGREAFFGNNAALTEEWYGSLKAGWRLSTFLSLNAHFRFDAATQPLTSADSQSSYDRAYGGVALSWYLRPKMTLSTGYEFFVKSDAPAGSNYAQQRVNLSLKYTF